MSIAELHHQGLLYRSSDELVQRACPVLDDAVRRGDHVVAAVDTATATLVSKELGDNAAGVEFHSPADALGIPVQTLITRHYQDVSARTEAAPLVFLSQRQPWMAPWDVAFSEAAFNVLLDRLPITMLCASAAAAPFDEIFLDTHPELVEPGTVRRNEGCRDTAAVFAAYPAPPPEPLPKLLAELSFGSARQLHRLRGLVQEHASALGLPAARIADLALAVTEVATNCLRAGGPGALRIGALPGRLIVELRDPNRTGALYGMVPPPLAGSAERVFWLARQLCDTVYVWHDGRGTGLRATARLPEIL